MAFWNKKPQVDYSKWLMELKIEIDSQKLHVQQIERQLEFVKLQFKDLKTIVSRRLKLEELEEVKKEKNKSPSVFCDLNGNPLDA